MRRLKINDIWDRKKLLNTNRQNPDSRKIRLKHSIWSHFTKKKRGNVWHMVSSEALEVESKNVLKESCLFAWLKRERKDIMIHQEARKLWNQRWTCWMFVCFSYPVVSNVFIKFIFKFNLHLYLPFCFSQWHQCWLLTQKLGGSLNLETKSKNHLGKEIIMYQLFFPTMCLNRLDYFNKRWKWW